MIFRMAIYLLAGVVLFIGIARLFTELYANSRLYLPGDAPKGRVAIVFGAGLSWDGSPSPVLKDRISTAAELYFSGKIQKILMSGDNRFLDYNEPGAMLEYGLELGIPRQDIVLDYAGRRTYDTCYRARAIFGITDALLVTQRFHLPRAVFTCNFLGIKGSGVIADRRPYNRRSLGYWNVREVGATVVALWDVWVTRPLPVLGSPEPIFPTQTNLGKNPQIGDQSGTNIAQR